MEYYRRRVRKSTNKKILALYPLFSVEKKGILISYQGQSVCLCIHTSDISCKCISCKLFDIALQTLQVNRSHDGEGTEQQFV